MALFLAASGCSSSRVEQKREHASDNVAAIPQQPIMSTDMDVSGSNPDMNNHLDIRFPHLWVRLATDGHTVEDKALRQTDVAVINEDLSGTGDYLKFELDSDWELVSATATIESSVTISDEGPHHDLRDFRHHRSSPEPMLRAANELKLPERTSGQYPEVSPEQFQTDLEKYFLRHPESAPRWKPLSETCGSPNSTPCSVAESMREFTFVLGRTLPSGDDECVTYTLRIHIPMGC